MGRTKRELTPEQRQAESEYQKRYYQERKEAKKAYARAYHEKNRDAILADRREKWAANKDAIAAERRQAYAENPTKALAWCKAYRERHREIVLERKRAYHHANKSTCNAKSRAWHKANRQRVAEYKRRRRLENPLHSRLARQRRRARARSAGGSFTASDIKSLLRLQRGLCAVCRTKFKGNDYDVDHVVPLSRGGSNHRKNLQLLCPVCNRSKGAKDPIDFMQSKGFLL